MAAEERDFSLDLDLKIISLNISGLREKTAFVKNIIFKNKPHILCLQETNIKDDYNRNKVFDKLGLDLENSYFNYPITKSNGTAIFCLSSDIKCNNVFLSDNGRVIVLELCKNTFNFTIVNVYAPTNPTERPHFLDTLLSQLLNLKINNYMIIAGDFNITLEERDITGERGKLRRGRPELYNLIQTLRLKDAFRYLHPTSTDTTFISKTHFRSSRIDHIYVSQRLPVSNACHIKSTLDFTDHKGVQVYISNTLNNNSTPAKSAHWKFNDTLLENTAFVECIRDTINANHFYLTASSTSILKKFDALNNIFKQIAIKFSKQIERERNEKLEILN